MPQLPGLHYCNSNCMQRWILCLWIPIPNFWLAQLGLGIHYGSKQWKLGGRVIDRVLSKGGHLPEGEAILNLIVHREQLNRNPFRLSYPSISASFLPRSQILLTLPSSEPHFLSCLWVSKFLFWEDVHEDIWFLRWGSLKTEFEPENCMQKVDWWVLQWEIPGGKSGWGSMSSWPWIGIGLRWGLSPLYTVLWSWCGSSELPQIERGEPDLCILKSANHSPWDTLWEGGITLARAVSCNRGQFSVRNAAVSCQKLLPQPLRRRTFTVNRGFGQSLWGATIYGVTEKSVNYKSGDLSFGSGSANSVGP